MSKIKVIQILFWIIFFINLKCYVLFAQNLEGLKKGVVKISTSNQKGTGFVVCFNQDRGLIYIVTAGHVVDSGKEIRVVFYERLSQSFSAKLLYRDESTALEMLRYSRKKIIRELGELEKKERLKNLDKLEKSISKLKKINLEEPLDLALLEVKIKKDLLPKKLFVLSLPNTPIFPREGDRVTVIGFPRKLNRLSVRRGYIFSKVTKSIIFSEKAEEGFSGSPMIDNKNKIIGLIFKTEKDHSFAIPSEFIKFFLQGTDIPKECLTFVPPLNVCIVGKQMWQRTKAAGYMTWDKASKYAIQSKQRKLMGYNNWRLPAKEELIDLAEYSKRNPGQISDTDKWYWSNEEKGLSYAWLVNGGQAKIKQGDFDDDKISKKARQEEKHAVRLVRDIN